MTGTTSITSSAANGQCLVVVTPQYAHNSTLVMIASYTDGASNLNVNALPTIANLTKTSITGNSYSTYYTNLRVTAFKVSFTYIGDALHAGGEASICFDNVDNIIAGWNVRNNIQDSMFYSKGRADTKISCIWIPQDPGDYQFRLASDYQFADKATSWGTMTFAATGLPLSTPVYDVNWTINLS